MFMKVRWPRAFLASVALLVVLGLAGVVLAEPGDGPTGADVVGIHPAPPGQLPEEVTEEDVAFALAVLNDSPRVDLITGDQPLRTAWASTDGANGRKLGVIIEFHWDKPVDSSGPWTTFRCHQTRYLTGEAPWEGLTGLIARVTLGTGEIRTLAPGASFYVAGEPTSPIGVRGRPIDNGTATTFSAKCPPGLDDD